MAQQKMEESNAQLWRKAEEGGRAGGAAAVPARSCQQPLAAALLRLGS